MAGFLDRSLSVAPPGYNRYLVPPAALAVHLCIGQAYAFSTFNLPMSKLIGITQPGPDDWTLAELGWIFSIAIGFLGLSAAIFGPWVESGGPRRAMFTAALLFSAGFFVSSLGIDLHQLWLVYLGYGVLGGCGLGIGYIAPVSTLIKWFPDRPGMATGFAIMGFGGGALIGAPLSVDLMAYFKTEHSLGVAQTFLVMGTLYLCMMIIGAALIRVPAEGWKPEGYVRPAVPKTLVTTANVDADTALRTPQFYLLWGILCLNVTAGIGVLSQASPMIQEMFPGKVSAAAAGGFVGLLSLFNMGGRLFWSSISDKLGRRRTYMVFFLLGIVLYATVPTAGHMGSRELFVIGFVIILSMYGGGFATIPAYLRDLFGTMQVGAIHGRLLTAWAVAGILGPQLVGCARQYQIDHGAAKADAYSITMYLMAGLLFFGFICDYFVTSVDDRFHHRTMAGTAGGRA
jgi:MFS family permease